MSTETKSRYERFGKAYYEKNKETLLAAEKEKKRWVEYYEKNKEAIKERNRIAYYKRKGKEVPPPKSTVPKPEKKPLKSAEMIRVEELVEELKTLLPGVIKSRAKVKLDTSPELTYVLAPSGPPGAPLPVSPLTPVTLVPAHLPGLSPLDLLG